MDVQRVMNLPVVGDGDPESEERDRAEDEVWEGREGFDDEPAETGPAGLDLPPDWAGARERLTVRS